MSVIYECCFEKNPATRMASSTVTVDDFVSLLHQYCETPVTPEQQQEVNEQLNYRKQVDCTECGAPATFICPACKWQAYCDQRCYTKNLETHDGSSCMMAHAARILLTLVATAAPHTVVRPEPAVLQSLVQQERKDLAK